MGSRLQIFYKHLQAKSEHLFLMILTKALSHSLRATICNQWALGTMARIGHPHGPWDVACDCFLYLFQACMRQAPIVEKTPATCGSLRAHYVNIYNLAFWTLSNMPAEKWSAHGFCSLPCISCLIKDAGVNGCCPKVSIKGISPVVACTALLQANSASFRCSSQSF